MRRRVGREQPRARLSVTSPLRRSPGGGSAGRTPAIGALAMLALPVRTLAIHTRAARTLAARTLPIAPPSPGGSP
ncbi:hypothetical protein RGQ21_66120 [Kitasatospora aureofaciens]|nr:hypothetical protein RGQ21_66120 [Kitasatospora aureofaciens]